jgi:hypothetical protein
MTRLEGPLTTGAADAGAIGSPVGSELVPGGLGCLVGLDGPGRPTDGVAPFDVHAATTRQIAIMAIGRPVVRIRPVVVTSPASVLRPPSSL